MGRSDLFSVIKILLTVSGTLLIGCGPGVPPGPPAYREGWRDGCESAYFAAGDISHEWRNDVARAEFDTQYKTGWSYGFFACAQS